MEHAAHTKGWMSIARSMRCQMSIVDSFLANLMIPNVSAVSKCVLNSDLNPVVTRWLADLYGKSTNGMWIWWFKASATGFQTRNMSAPRDSMAQEYNSMNPSKMNLVFFKDDGSHLEEELIPLFFGDFKVGAVSDKSQSTAKCLVCQDEKNFQTFWLRTRSHEV